MVEGLFVSLKDTSGIRGDSVVDICGLKVNGGISVATAGKDVTAEEVAVNGLLDRKLVSSVVVKLEGGVFSSVTCGVNDTGGVADATLGKDVSSVEAGVEGLFVATGDGKFVGIFVGLLMPSVEVSPDDTNGITGGVAVASVGNEVKTEVAADDGLFVGRSVALASTDAKLDGIFVGAGVGIFVTGSTELDESVLVLVEAVLPVVIGGVCVAALGKDVKTVLTVVEDGLVNIAVAMLEGGLVRSSEENIVEGRLVGLFVALVGVAV